MGTCRKLALLAVVALVSACSTGSDNNDKQDPVVSYGTWTWVSGSQSHGQWGQYGDKGVASPANTPGARIDALGWLGKDGALWLMGGEAFSVNGYIHPMNDLWRFDPATSEWTWISGSSGEDQAGVYGTKGIADPANCPGGRSAAVSWTDSQGRLWLFGGNGYDKEGGAFLGWLNDLWRYDPAAREWTWISGSDTRNQAAVYGTKGVADAGNVPGPRVQAVSWIDRNDNLWLFGGPSINDLWKFNPQTLEWTWVSGSDVPDQPGVYGVKGVSGPDNVPGAREMAASCRDPQGRFWLFGGQRMRDGYRESFNDLWMFDPATLEWTWVSGSQETEQPGVYGTKGTAGPLNAPGGRMDAVASVDAGGKLWLFGGAGWASAAANLPGGLLNDLWTFDPVTVQWTWISGVDHAWHQGIYGTKGTPAAANAPGAREAAVSWLDAQGRFWMFGGRGTDSEEFGSSEYLSDLWRFKR